MAVAAEACELAEVVSRGRVAIPIHGNGNRAATHGGATGHDGDGRNGDCDGYDLI